MVQNVGSNKKRILVTGGAGFVGYHLCKKLMQQGHEIICVDNLSTSEKSNVVELQECKNFEFIRHDITFPLYLEVDQIYNLACPASPVNYQKDPIQTVKSSVVGSLNVLGLAKRLKVPILQASTSEVYGDPLMHPQNEGYWGNVNPIGPRSCYDEGKRCAESLFFDYHRQHRVKVKIARIFNTYGPKMHFNDGRVVSNFIVQALQGMPIEIYGRGRQTRSFCYVSDLVDGLIKLMNTPDEVTGPINIGNPTELSILELAKKILSTTGSASELIFKALPIDDPTMRRPDITLATSVLEWKPTVDIEQGLRKTIDDFKLRLSVMK